MVKRKLRLTLTEDVGLWFAGDHHFLHFNILKYDKAGFGSVEEMKEQMIANHNDMVGEKDIVFFLGDLIFPVKRASARDILGRLSGRKFLILGNHDQLIERHRDLQGYFEDIFTYLELQVQDVDGDVSRIVLCHSPILEWVGCHKGTWHLHGHTHGNEKPWYQPQFRIQNVGVMLNDYSPWSYYRLKEIMDGREILNHH